MNRILILGDPKEARAERGALYLDAMADAIARWARSELT